jgi:hypothetical protein
MRIRRKARAAEPALTPPAESKGLESLNADYWRALRRRVDGGRHEHSGTDHRKNDRSRAWGTLVLYRWDQAPLDDQHIGVVEDTSPGGLYIGIDQPPPCGTLLRMRIYCQAGPRGISVVEASGRVGWCNLHEPRGAGVQLLDFADGERGRQAWLALVQPTGANVALVAPPAAVPLQLPGAASRRSAGTGPAAGGDRQRWKTRSRR